MGTGYIMVHAYIGEEALPADGALVTIKSSSGETLATTRTDASGNTQKFPVEAPDASLTLDPYYNKPAYSTCEVDIQKDGFLIKHVHDVEIVDTQLCILPVQMYPASPELPAEIDTTIPQVGLLIHARNQVDPPAIVARQVVIPDYITVHLGVPSNASAKNVRVRFPDYVKNVTSSEIYSTWPHSSLLSNLHAITTFALNRVYTEWYRSRGFNFDITNSTSYDQYYREGGPVFENISRLADEYFNVYAHRYAFQNPFFTQFCNGTTVTCAGMSQWGTVSLAEQGMSPIEILRYYYPDDLVLTVTDNIMSITPSYPGYALRVGSSGEDVRRMQNFLNRIRVNFPLIPQISNPNGVFGADTQTAVRVFQSSFQLTPDGIIGMATWNKISFIYVAVTHMAELESEGERITIGQTPPNTVLSQGSRGVDVIELQYILNVVSEYFPTVPPVIQDGVFGPSVKNAVIEFQKTFNLTPDGVVGPATWDMLYTEYRSIRENVHVPPDSSHNNTPPYPGTPLRPGSTGADVRLMQAYLNTIRAIYPEIPVLVVDAIFGEYTKAAVEAFQKRFGLVVDGIIGPMTWNEIVRQYNMAVNLPAGT